MNILITGGNGRLARKFKETSNENIFNPSKSELNLLDKQSIIDFYNSNPNIDGIILNATMYPSEFYEFDNYFNDDILNRFINSFKLVAIGNQQLINLYKNKIKFVINISSGVTNNKKPHGDYFGYKLVKTISNFIIQEYSVNKQNLYDNIKFIILNPTHMVLDDDYNEQSKILSNIIKSIDKFKTGFEYYTDKSKPNQITDVNETHSINI